MARRQRGRPVNGWLVLDKPVEMTSTHAVNVAKRLLDARKAGHAGTLDPLATGILPIAFGEATKTMNFVVDGTKAYRFTVRWGAETTTDDAEGAVTETSEMRPALPEIEAALPAFTGPIMQVPPKFSAIKVDGQRAYDLARDGADVELAAREVEVYDLRVVDMPDDDHTVIEAECGKGTYVRAIARDLGRALGCRAHVRALRRTRVGPFLESAAVTLDGLRDAADKPDLASSEDADHAARPAATAANTADALLLPLPAALTAVPEIAISAGDAGRIRRGQALLLRGRDAPVLEGTAYTTVKGELVALGEVERGSFIPTRVFNLGQ